MCETNGKWRLKGFDEFEGAFYNYSSGEEYDSQEDAEKAAAEKLDELEVSQPSEMSGGQGTYGIQDRVFVVRPDGTSYRYTK